MMRMRNCSWNDQNKNYLKINLKCFFFLVCVGEFSVPLYIYIHSSIYLLNSKVESTPLRHLPHVHAAICSRVKFKRRRSTKKALLHNHFFGKKFSSFPLTVRWCWLLCSVVERMGMSECETWKIFVPKSSKGICVMIILF